MDSRKHEQAIREILDSLHVSLGKIDLKLAEATTTQLDLRDIANFQLLVIKAMGDDINSWEELVKRANDNSDRFHNEAMSLYLSIQNSFVGPDLKGFTSIPTEFIGKVKLIPANELQQLFSTTSPVLHAHLVVIIFGGSDLTKYQKLSFLALVLDKTSSITGRAAAGKYLALEANQYYSSLRKEPLLEWWSKNKARIKQESETKK